MAEAANGEATARSECGGEASVKLFVGQIPKSMAESQLLSIFSEIALVDEVNVIRDKISKASRGRAFHFLSL